MHLHSRRTCEQQHIRYACFQLIKDAIMQLLACPGLGQALDGSVGVGLTA